jgi:hypothetical protein
LLLRKCLVASLEDRRVAIRAERSPGRQTFRKILRLLHRPNDRNEFT